MFCNHPLYLVRKYFITSRGNPIPINQSFPTSLSLVHPPTSNLLSVSADLPILTISYKWNHRVGDLVTFCVVFVSVFTFFFFFKILAIYELFVVAPALFLVMMSGLLLQHTGLVALGYVGSYSPTWDQTHVPCLGRWICNH